jgi:hypothetical protein
VSILSEYGIEPPSASYSAEAWWPATQVQVSAGRC